MKLFRWLHKWLGVVMAPLVLMWFVTGFFMIFGDFPKASKEHKLQVLEPIALVDSLPQVSELRSQYEALTKSGAHLTSISIEDRYGTPLLLLKGSEGPITLDRRDMKRWAMPAPTLKDIEASTLRITGLKPMAVDSITQLNQWIPFSARRADLPFIKVVVDDGKGTTLYFSGTSGLLLQETNNHNRLYAYISAIPHWIYIWQLRQDVDLWKDVLIMIGIIGVVMVISGIVMGIYRMIQSRTASKRRWTPFTKRSSFWLHWHHLTGLLFGWVILTWMFSGWMSVDKLPKWMTGEPPREELYTLAQGEALTGEEQPDFARVLAKYPGAKSISFAHYMGQSYYTVVGLGEPIYLMAERGILVPLKVSAEAIAQHLEQIDKGIEVTSYETRQEYTSDYMPHPRGKRSPPLPALQVETAEGATLYVAMESPKVKVTNRETCLNHFAYHKLHSWQYLWAYHHPTLWLVVMFVLLAGGTVVSLTGFVLGWNVLFKKKKKKKKRVARAS